MSQASLTPCRHCGSSDVALRHRTLRDGSLQFLGQCQRCGQGTKAVTQPPPWSEEYQAPVFDEALREAARSAESHASPELFSAQGDSAAWRERYDSHLASESWARKRAKVMERSAGICEGCLDAPATAVHHLTYKHLGDELLWELVAVCAACHARCHPHLKD